MNKRFAAIAFLVAAVAVAAGLFASPANSHGNNPGLCFAFACRVSLTAAGPSPSTLTMRAEQGVAFFNRDSVTHTVVFANGLCSLTLGPGQGGYEGGFCDNGFAFYAGSYPYTVDGKFQGTVVTKALRRSVTLTARTHTVRRGTPLTLRGQVIWQEGAPGFKTPYSVTILARHGSKQNFEPIATISKRFHPHTTGWKLTVQPGVTTTYIVKATTQRFCSIPASRCAHPQGQVWTNAESRPFTVRIRNGGSR
jgi:hypothetical protein